jgi:hypothetical protein
VFMFSLSRFEEEANEEIREWYIVVDAASRSSSRSALSPSS